MKYFSCRLFAMVMISFCLLQAAGCGGGGDGEPSSDAGVQKVIGPEGGTIQVTDPDSAIYGVEVYIPAGALTQRTTITIEAFQSGPSLQDGLFSQYPTIRFSPATTFLKDVEITFPIEYLPPADEDSEEILGAFYWNADEAVWAIVPPILIDGNRMTIETTHFSLWKWGSIYLNQIEKGHFESWFEGMVDDWNELMQSVVDEFDYLSAAVDDWQQWAFCDHRDQILNHLRIVYGWTGEGLDTYLANKEFIDVCPYGSGCTRDNFLVLNPIFIEWIKLEIKILNAKVFLEAKPSLGKWYVDLLVEVALKSFLKNAYRAAVLEWDCDYRCMFKNGNFSFYFYTLVHNAAYISHDGIIVFHALTPCS